LNSESISLGPAAVAALHLLVTTGHEMVTSLVGADTALPCCGKIRIM
jgi:hypothetical protein